jgi:hypothetical protein
LSIRLIESIFTLDIPPTNKLVLIALADHAHKDGTGAYPSIERLAWKTGLSESAVHRAIRQSKRDGLIKPIGNVRGGRGNTTEYKFTLGKSTKGAPRAPFIAGRKLLKGAPQPVKRVSHRHPNQLHESAADGNLPSGLTLKGVPGDIPRKTHGSSHPPYRKPTPDDNGGVQFPASPVVQNRKQDIDRRYSERVDGFRKKILLKYEKQGYKREFLNLALDIIDQRAWDAGKRIASQKYFETSLENLDSKTIHIIDKKLDAGRCSPEDIFLDGELPAESEQARRAFVNGNRDLFNFPYTRKKLTRAVNFKALHDGRVIASSM